MAAGGSDITSTRRGAQTGQGATIRREDLAPLPSPEVHVPTIDSLDEICGWLGTFRERLHAARAEERVPLEATVQILEARHHMRRAELS